MNVEPGSYVIQSAVGNKVLDVQNASKDNGANYQIYTPNGTAAQTFNIALSSKGDSYVIKLKASGKRMDTAGNVNGHANVFQWEYSGARGQYWIFEEAGNGYVYIRNQWDYYLDVQDGKDRDSTNVRVWGYNGSGAQKWKLVKVSGVAAKSVDAGSYIIQSAVGNRVLDVQNASKDNGANCQIYTPNGTAAQTFDVAWNKSKNAYRVKLKASGRSMDTFNDANGGSNVIQFDSNANNGQAWVFEDAGGGYVYIRNLWGYYLDVKDGKDANSTNVQVWGYNGSSAQKWKLVKVSGKAAKSVADGTYTVPFLLGVRNLDVANGSKDNGANCWIYTANNTDAQIFNITWNKSKSAYRITNKGSKRSLDTVSDKNGAANVIQYDSNANNGQAWLFEDAGGGYVYIRNLWGYYLEVQGSKDADKQNVQVSVFSDSPAQKWKLVKYDAAAAEKAAAEKAASEKAASDAAAADSVAKLIAALPQDAGADAAGDVSAARVAYDALTADQKALVPGDSLALLVQAEAQVAEAKVAQEEAERAAAEAIAAAQKAIQAYRDAVAEGSAATDEEKVDAVRAAADAYAALTEDQKATVGTGVAAELEQAEAQLAAAKAAKEETERKAAEKAAADAAAVEAVVRLVRELPPLPGVSEGASVAKARAAYDALTVDQKALVPTSSLERLSRAETQVAQAKAEAQRKAEEEAARKAAEEAARQADDGGDADIEFDAAVLKAAKLTSVKKDGKKTLAVKWGKVSGVTGYQVRYSTSKPMKGAKVKKIAEAGKTGVKLTKLKSKKRYWVQVRTYTKTASGTVKGPWSKAKSAKTK